MHFEKVSLADRATSHLRRLIVTGGLEPGRRLTEQEISDQLQVARGTVRAAFAALEAENLLIRRPYAGWAVKEVSAQVLRESYQLRGAFEELAVRLLALGLDEEKRRHFEALYQRLTEAEASDRQDLRVEADLGFHRGIVALCGNGLLQRQYEAISGHTEWLYRWSELNWPARINLLEWHQPICEAILSGDAEAAVAAARVHTERSLSDDERDLHMKTN
ncbi:GntR family transcriptional regulator [Pseudogemmobacter humi]|uniref:Putative HTH-type transcriptional regulator YdfH n=1 Tax=Pseudogemmobacter humi TaxID=2483812 RepID=A0A3P5WKW7_9RHOB|nr:GntR family transcriptional regulator [Pseudogemmobacter humi]VDC22318.1 putative HTH-type transcriptional regulator YdfH [Pseudogemmobacter humi]